MECPKCNYSLKGYANFCPNCGASLLNKCPHCGQTNALNIKYCPNCGTKQAYIQRGLWGIVYRKWNDGSGSSLRIAFKVVEYGGVAIPAQGEGQLNNYEYNTSWDTIVHGFQYDEIEYWSYFGHDAWIVRKGNKWGGICDEWKLELPCTYTDKSEAYHQLAKKMDWQRGFR